MTLGYQRDEALVFCVACTDMESHFWPVSTSTDEVDEVEFADELYICDGCGAVCYFV